MMKRRKIMKKSTQSDVKKSQMMPDKIELNGELSDWSNYLRWFLYPFLWRKKKKKLSSKIFRHLISWACQRNKRNKSKRKRHFRHVLKMKEKGKDLTKQKHHWKRGKLRHEITSLVQLWNWWFHFLSFFLPSQFVKYLKIEKKDWNE